MGPVEVRSPANVELDSVASSSMGAWLVGLGLRHVRVHASLFASVLVGVVCLGACGVWAGSAQAAPDRSQQFPRDLGSIDAVGRAIHVRVSPSRRLRVVVPGVVTITGPRRAFATRGVMVVRRSRAKVQQRLGVRAAGAGIDVSFRRTRLRKPLTLIYRVGALPRGHVARAMHVANNGEWDVKPARRVGSRGLRIRTMSFSSLVPAWLDPERWGSNLMQWGSNTANWVASGVGGRTPPLSNCGPQAPGWFSFEKTSDLVHVCTIDNAGRAEIQLKSNRGLSQLVRIPGNPAYVFVENLPDWLRGKLPWDTNKEVVLGPGQRMTVGYNRPTSDVSGQFVINPYAARAQLDNIARSVLDLVAGLDAVPATAFVAYAWTQCATDLQATFSESPLSTDVTLGKASCLITSLKKLAEDPDRARQIMTSLGASNSEADDLLRKADRLKKAAKAFGVLEQVKSHAIQSVDESLRALVKDGNDTVPIRMTAPTPLGGVTGPLTPNGLGVMRVGMTVAEAEQATGADFMPGGSPDGVCYFGGPQGRVVLVTGSDSRIDVFSVDSVSGIGTDRGVRVGDSLERVRQLYAGQLDESRLNDEVGQGVDLLHTPPEPALKDFAVGFGVVNGKVNFMSSGQASSVPSEEYCA